MLAMNYGVDSAGGDLLTGGVALAVHVGCHCSARVTNRNYYTYCRKFGWLEKNYPKRKHPTAGAMGLQTCN